jgi:hypothetical protein
LHGDLEAYPHEYIDGAINRLFHRTTFFYLAKETETRSPQSWTNIGVVFEKPFASLARQTSARVDFQDQIFECDWRRLHWCASNRARQAQRRCAKGDDHDIAARDLIGLQRVDRRHPVKDPSVLEEDGIQRIGEGINENVAAVSSGKSERYSK